MARQEEYSLLEQVVQMLGQSDEKKFARLIELVLNEAMKLERVEALQAQPYERTEDRTGYANGFKNKTVLLANGKVLLKIPHGICQDSFRKVMIGCHEAAWARGRYSNDTG